MLIWLKNQGMVRYRTFHLTGVQQPLAVGLRLRVRALEGAAFLRDAPRVVLLRLELGPKKDLTKL